MAFRPRGDPKRIKTKTNIATVAEINLTANIDGHGPRILDLDDMKPEDIVKFDIQNISLEDVAVTFLYYQAGPEGVRKLLDHFNVRNYRVTIPNGMPCSNDGTHNRDIELCRQNQLLMVSQEASIIAYPY